MENLHRSGMQPSERLAFLEDNFTIGGSPENPRTSRKYGTEGSVCVILFLYIWFYIMTKVCSNKLCVRYFIGIHSFILRERIVRRIIQIT